MKQSLSTSHSALMNVSWIASAGQEVVTQLAASSRLELLPDGYTVLLRGHDCSHLMVVVSGQLESSMTAMEGKRHVISRLGPGEVLGLIPLLDDAGAIHDTSSKGSTQLLLIPRESFRQTLAAHAALADQVIRLLSTRARNLYVAHAEKSLFRLDYRLARALLRLDSTENNHRIKITQAELAELLGVTRQSINLEMQKMEKAGWLKKIRGYLSILNVQALSEFAG